MTAKIVLIARGRRCAVCGALSSPINRFAMVTDGDGKNGFVHLGCLETWHAWQQTTCHHCGVGDRPDDPIGLFLDGCGSDVALHQVCWSRWRAGQQQTSEIDPGDGSTIDSDTDCLLCGGGPDVGDMWRVFTGSIEPDGWIHARCRDSYVALCRKECDVPCSG